MLVHPQIEFPRAALAAVLAVALVTASLSGCSAPKKPFGVIEPRIVPSSSELGSRTIARDFAFEDIRVQLSVPVDQAVYAGSETAQKSAIFFGGAQPGDWVPGYYRAFVDESHQTAFYASMAQALHQVRDREHLDAARYVELVTSMVQEMEYRTDPVSLAPKFPIETFGDGYGDCDDKTLLAAGLLSRDGYDVAILLFAPEKHVALGIRAPGLDYKNTGYAYVEMTAPSLVGIPTEKLAGGGGLTSQPVVIKIGRSTGAYTEGAQVDYIRTRLQQLRTTLDEMAKEIAAHQAELAGRRAALETAKQTVQAAADPAAQTAAVRRYNTLVDEYNAFVAKSNAFGERSNALAEAERYVAEHRNARPQVYERLRALAL